MKKKYDKNKMIALGVGSFLLGILLISVITIAAAPSLMMTESRSRYDFEETVERFQDKINESDWGILNYHDMQEVKSDLGYDVLPVKVFDLCSGHYSYQILRGDDERIVTPMMPCRMSIYEKSDGNTYIGRMNSGLVARLFGGTINDVMQNATAETEELIEPLLE